MFVDKSIDEYFSGRVKQVFVYITNHCQLHCRQCLYKPMLCADSLDMNFEQLISLLKIYHAWGAYKLSFLGGEPTLYYDKLSGKRLCDVIQEARKIGYKYIRIDTNGQFAPSFLDNNGIRELDEITFSLDGHDEFTNDIVRGVGSFKKCVENIRTAVSLGYNVQITTCVHKYSCPTKSDGVRNIDFMICLAKELGVRSLNFHPILRVGIARDNWIDSTDIDFDIWKYIYENVSTRSRTDDDSLKIRVPMRFADSNSVLQDREKYHYCPLDMGERALIMPDGQIKVCAFTIGTQECVARYDNDGIYAEINNSELSKIGSISGCDVCYNQKGVFGNNVPLCMSYKPHQEELVWRDIRNDF